MTEHIVETTRGPMRVADLEVRRATRAAPCGKVNLVAYFHEGVLVKQDVGVVVDADKIAGAACDVGQIG